MTRGDSAETILDNHTIPAANALVQAEPEGLRCLACANRCLIRDGKRGICRMRANKNGELRVPGHYVSGLQVDPIEKKPFYHVYPGRDALSFGMLGCNFHCHFCQNWNTSQVLQDDRAGGMIRPIAPDEMVGLAQKQGAPVIVSTYNEPLITADWAHTIFEEAVKQDLTCGFVSNGYATPEVIEYMKPVMNLFKVDLKCFRDEGYREVGGRLDSVLDSIRKLHAEGFWVELVTLVIPGFNDSPEELKDMAEFIAGIDPRIPWHVTAFHPDYKTTDQRYTSVDDLKRAYHSGKDAGLDYVYAGNLPGRVGPTENTYCHKCDALLVERRGFNVLENRMVGDTCPDCDATIPGVWEDTPPHHTTGDGLRTPMRL